MKESFLWDQFFSKVSEHGGGIEFDTNPEFPKMFTLTLGEVTWLTPFPCGKDIFDVLIRFDALNLPKVAT